MCTSVRSGDDERACDTTPFRAPSRHGCHNEGGLCSAPGLAIRCLVWPTGPEELRHGVLGAPQPIALAVPPDILASAPPKGGSSIGRLRQQGSLAGLWPRQRTLLPNRDQTPFGGPPRANGTQWPLVARRGGLDPDPLPLFATGRGRPKRLSQEGSSKEGSLLTNSISSAKVRNHHSPRPVGGQTMLNLLDAAPSPVPNAVPRSVPVASLYGRAEGIDDPHRGAAAADARLVVPPLHRKAQAAVQVLGCARPPRGRDPRFGECRGATLQETPTSRQSGPLRWGTA